MKEEFYFEIDKLYRFGSTDHFLENYLLIKYDQKTRRYTFLNLMTLDLITPTYNPRYWFKKII